MVGVIWWNKRLDKMLSQSVSVFVVLVEQRILLTQLPKIMLNLPVIYGSRIAVLIFYTFDTISNEILCSSSSLITFS